MLWSLWLWDILHALHSGNPLCFSVEEVLSNIPGSTVPFLHVYRDLLHESRRNSQPLIATLGSPSRDQASLLLFAVLSDSITARRSLGSVNSVVCPASRVDVQHNPFAPSYAHAELERIQSQLSIALDRWNNHFSSSTSSDLVALFQYCRLYLSCPEIPRLDRAACHREFELRDTANFDEPIQVSISDQSVNHAWTLLDAAAKVRKSQEMLCPAWMPIVVFHASLVVWAKISLGTKSGRETHTHGSIRTLLAFKVELEAMHWPCCVQMGATLEKLMST